MPFALSQIVGLIEIENLDSAGSDRPSTVGQEEGSLGEMFSFLALGAAAAPLVRQADEFSPSAPPAHRLSGVLNLSADRLLADLTQLRVDLADAAARFRLRLAAAA